MNTLTAVVVIICSSVISVAVVGMLQKAGVPAWVVLILSFAFVVLCAVLAQRFRRVG